MYKKINFIFIELISILKIYIILLKLLINKDLSLPKQGGITQTFEKNCRKFLGVKFVLGTNNGTSALHSAFFSISNKNYINNCLKGKEIICPNYTWWASILPAVNLGAKICFVDINKENLTINIKSFKKAINKNTIAVLVPHLWGESADIIEIINIAREKGIYVIEDASHCFGTTINGKMLGTFGDIGVFSLQANKPISGGEGGIIVTNNRKLYERFILLGHYERINTISVDYNDYKNTGLGFKYRIHPVACAIANIKLQDIYYRSKLENEAIDYLEQKFKYLGLNLIRSNYIQRGPQFGYKLIIDFINKEKKDKFLSLCKEYNIPIEKEYFSQLDKEKVFSEKCYTFDGLENIRSIYDKLYTLKPIKFLEKKKIDVIIKYLEYIFKIL